ncbi:hypothetical protein OC846_000277 [Tilletia horrida]|uniref:Nudix hydrolase domain-containing protein n=1 Tax=Tilletia horrida TaxID=155126 RepID=A0AAN6GYH7_9BASI|nr:hypothetical protein OC846_000277 [Tilletia horrida]KAK0570315.1 hypothetical protein OC861_000058 [Tilletia horrida]
MSAAANESEHTLLEIVDLCHNSEPHLDPSLHPFIVDSRRYGYLPNSVFQAVERELAASQSSVQPRPLEIVPASASLKTTLPGITFTETCSKPEERSAALQALAEKWRSEKKFPYPLDGWRNELYAVWGPNHQIAFRLERAACALFGVATFGVHMTAYTPDMQVWIPRRAANKPTWPSYLDNTAAGGITAGEPPGESMVRESWEEAGFSEDLVRKHLKATGVITYVYTTPEGLVQPECEYTYDLALPSADIVPNPVDGEAEAFELYTFEQTMRLIRQAKFKPNCALVLIDFYIRHGLITPENEPDYIEIVAKMHTSFGLPMP